MKRHIPIFTFLLGVSVVSLDVRAATKPCIITDQPLDITIRDSYGTKVRSTSSKSLSQDYYYLLYDGDWTSLTAPQRIGKKLDGWYTLDNNADPSDITLAKLSARLEESDTFAAGKIGSARTTSWNGTYGVIGPKYSYKELKIVFDGNGATSGSTAAQGGLNYDSKNIVLNANGFLRTGYAFANWKTAAGKSFTGGATVQGTDFWVGGDDGSFDSTLYAQWTENTYTIGSSGENCTVTVASSAKYTDAVTVSWTPSSAAGKVFTLSSAAVYAGDTKIRDLPKASPTTFRMSDLNAYYGAVTVKVVYTGAQTQHTLTVASADSQKGSVGKEPDASEYGYGSPVTIRATANDGYAFEKWSDGSTQAERQLTVTSNATYTASFTNRQYVITFHANGGESDPDPMVVTYGSYIGTLPTAKQFKKTFRGWYTEQAGGSQVTRLDVYKWTIDIELFAQWDAAEEVIITADVLPSAEAGTVTISPAEYEKDDSVTVAAKAATGYGFKDWSDGNTAPVTNFTVVGNLKLTAVFTGNVYKVTFMAPEGAQPKQERFVTFGSEYGDLPTATWSKDESDMAFAGWNTDPDGEGDMIFSNTVVRTASKQTLYAMWKSIPTYHVAFDGNESTSGEMGPQKMYCGITANLTSNMYERAGYHFRGWATNTTDAAALKIAYADGQSVTDIAPTNGTATLYAAWEEITLSEAMHCTNLVWTSDTTIGTEGWQVMVGDGCGFEGSGSCVLHAGDIEDVANRQCLTTTFTTGGHLSFRWKGTYIGVTVGTAVIQYYQSVETWNAFVLDISDEEVPVKIEIRNYGLLGESTEIDQMTWTPGGLPPGPEDAVTISSATVSDGKFTLSFTSDARFDYNLLTNANLLIKSWGIMDTFVGDGSIHTFKPEIRDDQPQLFYKVETIRKR